MRTTQPESEHSPASAAAREGRGRLSPRVRRKARPSQATALSIAEGAAVFGATQYGELRAEIVDRDVAEHEAWEQRRHDLDMRLAVLIGELDRSLTYLHVLLERYNELQLERAQAEPPIRGRNPIPSRLLALVSLTRGRLRLQAHG